MDVLQLMPGGQRGGDSRQMRHDARLGEVVVDGAQSVWGVRMAIIQDVQQAVGVGEVGGFQKRSVRSAVCC